MQKGIINYYLQILKNIKVLKGRLNYYLSLLMASFYFIVKRRIVNPQRYFIGESIVLVNGVKLIVNKQTSFGFYLSLNFFEPNTFEYIGQVNGNIFIDVGANAGGYTISFAKNFIKVLAIEPNPEMAKIIRRNSEINNYKNIEVIEAALSSYNGTGSFYIPDISSQVASLDRNWSYIKNINVLTIQVQVMTLDTLIRNINYPTIDLIKIDAEGMEIEILNGAKEAFSKTKRIVIETEKTSTKKVIQILKENGYTVRFLEGNEELGGNLLAEKNIP